MKRTFSRRLQLAACVLLVAAPTMAAQDLEAAFRSPRGVYSPQFKGQFSASASPADLYVAGVRQILGRDAAPREGWVVAPPAGEGPRAPVAQQPYAALLKDMKTCLARTAVLAWSGEPVVDIVLVAAQADADAARAANAELEASQLAFMSATVEELRKGRVAEGRLALDERRFRSVVLAGTQQLAPEVAEVLKALAAAGGTVVAFRCLPETLAQPLFGLQPDAKVKERIVRRGKSAYIPHDERQLPVALRVQGSDLFLYPPSRDVLFCHRRDTTADWYVVANLSDRRVEAHATIRCDRMPEVWDAATGRMREAIGVDRAEGGVILPLNLEAYQTIGLVFRRPLTERRVRRASGLAAASVEWGGNAARVIGRAQMQGRYTVVTGDGRKAQATVGALPPELLIEGPWGFATAQPYAREPAEVSTLRAAPLGAKQSAEGVAAPEFDDSAWDEVHPGDALPFLKPKWEASWLVFQGDGAKRYFRKSFELPAAPKEAKLTVTVDNQYELFVNGEKIGADKQWEQAETYDVTARLKPGKNVVAVLAINEGGIAAALAQLRIIGADGRIVRVGTDGTWKMAEAEAQGWTTAGFDDAAWKAPKVEGKPPRSPWGDVPGLPPEPRTTERVCYRFLLPPGTSRVLLPPDTKAESLYVGGRAVRIAKQEADLTGLPADRRNQALLVVAAGEATAPALRCACEPGRITLGTWTAEGFSRYSGRATYTRRFRLPREYRGRRLLLDLGKVGVAASVRLNKKSLGAGVLPPHRFDVTEALKSGDNELAVTVASTLANSKGAGPQPSGLIGPVKLIPYETVEVNVGG